MLDGRGLSCFRFVAVAIDFRATFAAISRINPPCPLLDSTGSNFRLVEIDGDLLLVFAVVIRVIGFLGGIAIAIGWGTYKKTKTQFGDMAAILMGIVFGVMFYLFTSLVLIYMLGYDSQFY